MELLEKKYYEITKPTNFIKLFNDFNEFEEWCRIGDETDIECAINHFEKYELYEYCAILKKVKDEKTKNINPRTIGLNQRDLPQGHQG